MTSVRKVDVTSVVLDIGADCSVTTRQRKPGPPVRIDGMTLGLVTMRPGESPHNGEMHPDGDEILYVISGTLIVTSDSMDEPLSLTAGQACVVPKGEWHQVDCLEHSTLLHITPGPNGEARF